ncbi:Lysyl-lysine 2,3-aminomutase [Moritella sp. JT01]|uniref:EF-P beta-lysylation protein EpmB n=1 Tax=Moritella sp. JT01 TaxID=756698 RepID=UPI00079C9492|nr:EF-P beta-lysylation protein EpmB [Moritella sp. JT01]KXO13622.1 Lysyl-lysine 2,3-aminomutase [Moritella sp. JT01]
MPQMITRNDQNMQGNWKKDLANAISDPRKLLFILELTEEAFQADFAARQLFPMRVPQSFVDRMEKGNPKDPLFLQVMPKQQEFIQKAGFIKDPLDEHESVVPGLLHKYTNRVLFIVRGGCAINCRYCFRRHFPYQDNSNNKHEWQQAIDYIRSKPEIIEVIFSGGDPLMANDEQLGWLVKQLEQIPHLKRLRIHTRLPVVMPSRVTDEFVTLLKQSSLRCSVVLHINHPNELAAELPAALAKLTTAGISLYNQAVLLADINDNADDLVELHERLFDNRIQPYYLHLLDKVEGASHFDVPEEKAVDIMNQLLLRLPGFLVPKLVREIGGEKSKTPISI